MPTARCQIEFDVHTDHGTLPGPDAIANGFQEGLPSAWFEADDGDDFWVDEAWTARDVTDLPRLTSDQHRLLGDVLGTAAATAADPAQVIALAKTLTGILGFTATEAGAIALNMAAHLDDTHRPLLDGFTRKAAA